MPNNSNTEMPTAETVTVNMIRSLFNEASLAYDADMQRICMIAQGMRPAGKIPAALAELRRGWHLAGAGPARFGWARYSPAGKCTFVGRTMRLAARALCADAINAASAAAAS